MKTLSENFQRKKKLAENIHFDNNFSFSHQCLLNLHQIPLEFSFSSEALVQLIFDQYPLMWLNQGQKPVYKIQWIDSEKFGWSAEEWENDPRFDCETYMLGSKHIALHRDFVAIVDGVNIRLIAPYTLADGFFNFLRWLVPLHFIEQNKLLLHSSCVVGPGHKAFFCLGPSGAGKSTISSLAPKAKILGDDMNILKVSDGKCWAQAGGLGQSVSNPKEYNNWYEVGGFFWLKKSKFFQITAMPQAHFMKHLYQSVANVFWDQIGQEKMEKIISLVTQISELNRIHELQFSIEPDIWPQIFLKMNSQDKVERSVEHEDPGL